MHIIRTPVSSVLCGFSELSFSKNLDKQSTARRATAASLSFFAPVGLPSLSSTGSLSLVDVIICNNFLIIYGLLILSEFAQSSIWA